MRRFDSDLSELLETQQARHPWQEAQQRYPWQETQERPEEETAQLEEEEAPPEPELSQARSLLTEPHPAGFGEVLVTKAWLAPEDAQAEPSPEQEQPPRWDVLEPEGRKIPRDRWGRPKLEEEKPPDRQREWETRQELRQLGLLREQPFKTWDARWEEYWSQVAEAKQEATRAIVDPYTEFAAGLADAKVDEIAEYQAVSRDYGREGGALLEVGRAYVAIGRLKSARSVLQAAAKNEPRDASIWRNLGIAHLFGRANKDAVKALRNALALAPGDFRTELALATAYYHSKDYARAEEHFRRIAGPSGLRATARSLLVCSLRMQGNWDEARVELGFLKDAQPGDWEALADQCRDCVERGEQKREGPLRQRRRSRQILKTLAAVAAGGGWTLYAAARDLFEKETAWAVIPLLALVMLLIRGLRGISGAELPTEFGNAEPGLPCWQTTAWVRPRTSEF